MIRAAEVWLHLFSALNGSEWLSSRVKRLRNPLNLVLFGHQSQSERFGDDNNFLPVPAIEPLFLGGSPRSLAIIPAEISPPPDRKLRGPQKLSVSRG